MESPGSGERRGFASLEDLFKFLKAQITPSDRGNVNHDMGGKGGNA